MSAQSSLLVNLLEEPGMEFVVEKNDAPAESEEQPMSGEALYRLGLEASVGEDGRRV